MTTETTVEPTVRFRFTWEHFVKLIPTIVIALWMAAITIIVFTNFSNINANTDKRDQTICAEDNVTRDLSSQIIAVGANGDTAASPQWFALQQTLKAQLVPINCSKLPSLTARAP